MEFKLLLSKVEKEMWREWRFSGKQTRCGQDDEENGERLRSGEEWRGSIGRKSTAVVVCDVQTACFTDGGTLLDQSQRCVNEVLNLSDCGHSSVLAYYMAYTPLGFDRHGSIILWSTVALVVDRWNVEEGHVVLLAALALLVAQLLVLLGVLRSVEISCNTNTHNA